MTSPAHCTRRWLCVCGLALASAGCGAWAQEQIKADLDKAARSVVSVEAKIGDRALLGAGVVAVRERDAVIVVTANHVVRQGATEAGALSVRFKDLPQKALAAVLLPGFDKADDIAVFRVEHLREQGLDPCSLPALRFSAAPVVRRGHGVFPIGNPAGVAWRVPAQPDTVTDIGEHAITFQSALIDNGHSGGGLFNAFGDLVGIIRADQPPYGVATRVERAGTLLRGWVPAADVDACAAPVQADAAPRATAGAVDFRATPLEQWGGNDTDTSRWGPLFLAIRNGQVDAVRQKVGAKELDPDPYRPPWPLHWAAALGQVEIVKQLILMGAKKNASVYVPMPGSPYGESMGTPLHAAARANQVEAMKVLIRAGAALEAEVDYGSQGPGSPLAAAARYDRREAAQFLIDAGADLSAGSRYQDGWGSTPLAQAVAHGHVEMIKLLLHAKAPLVPANPPAGEPTLMRVAVQSDQLAALRYLISIKAPMECSGRAALCETPVHEALVDHKADALQLLLQAGANPNASSFEPYLQLAMELHDPRILQLLLKAGANPNAKDRDGKSMLSRAQAAEDNDAVAALQAYGARR